MRFPKDLIIINLKKIIINSSLSKEFNISTMSSCGCCYNEISFKLPKKLQVNFTIIPSDFSKELNGIQLLRNNTSIFHIIHLIKMLIKENINY